MSEAPPTVTELEPVECESSGEEDQLWNKMETVKDLKNVNKKRKISYLLASANNSTLHCMTLQVQDLKES